MTNAAHTPGPWENSGQFIVAPDPKGIHPDIYIAEIVETDDEGRMATPEQQAANARLIAAAPELLDLAKFALRYLPRQECLQFGALVSQVENGHP